MRTKCCKPGKSTNRNTKLSYFSLHVSLLIDVTKILERINRFQDFPNYTEPEIAQSCAQQFLGNNKHTPDSLQIII